MKNGFSNVKQNYNSHQIWQMITGKLSYHYITATTEEKKNLMTVKISYNDKRLPVSNNIWVLQEPIIPYFGIGFKFQFKIKINSQCDTKKNTSCWILRAVWMRFSYSSKIYWQYKQNISDIILFWNSITIFHFDKNIITTTW